jgi:hypothetical protein
MRLIKMLPDKVQIKSNDEDFVKCKINDLFRISDGHVELVIMVSGMTETDVQLPIDEEEFLSTVGIKSVKTIDCSIIGSIVCGKFTATVDQYPTTNVTADRISDDEFNRMLVKENSGFSIGKYANYNCEVFLNGNKFYQRHSCIIGNTGSGKSETVTKIIEVTAKETNCNIVVFDIHGEYSGLSYVDTLKIGDGFSFPAWMLGFSDFVSNVLKVKEESASVVMSALKKVYYFLCPEGNEDKPCYFNFCTMLDCMKELNEQVVGTGEFYKTGDRAGIEKTIKGDYNGKLSGVINTMETLLSDSRFLFLTKDINQSYINTFVRTVMGNKKPVKIIDLSGIPHDVAILIIGSVARLIYNIQARQKVPIPITLVCDEAHVYIPVDSQLSASQKRIVSVFENIAKEGRKFGITLFVASQRPSELNRTIMAQCANHIVMKLNNENDKTLIKGILPDGASRIIETTTMFSPGDAIVIGDCVPIPLKIHVDLADERPLSKTINFWDEWKKRKINFDYASSLIEYMKK